MTKAVIVSGARTPFGKFGGQFQGVKAVELGGLVIKEALLRGDVSASEVDECIVGMVLQGGQGQIPSRQAAHLGGLPWSVPTETINKVCASGMRSITLGEQLIRANDAEVIVAGGMESMSTAPYFMEKARFGFRMGDGKIADLMVHDGLTCSFTKIHMGSYGNGAASELEISREEQDQWSYESHQKAIAAITSGRLTDEIVPVLLPVKKGQPLLVSKDESPRADTSLEKLARLAPVFDTDGTITAGNAPGVNDGACAVVLMSKTRAENEGKQVLATIVDHTTISVEPANFPKTPALAINKLLKKTGKSVHDIDLFEVNEAFAAVALAAVKLTGIDANKLNVNGGAVALGHPIGASGARIVLTLAYELKRRGGGIGIAAICSGGGQGDAIMIEV